MPPIKCLRKINPKPVVKKITTLALLCTFYIGIAQNAVTHGIVTYSISLERHNSDTNETIKKNPEIKPYFEKLASLAENLSLVLKFSEKRSMFELAQGLGVGDQEVMMPFVKVLASKGVYYTDLKEKSQILQTKQGRELYSIKSNIENIEWQLTNEKKKIGDFICYKATYKKKRINDYFLVTAWYAPSIPLAFGPKEYAGSLPGLIMEIEDPLAYYRCTSINLNPKKEITIPFPDEATITTITEEEYQQKGNAAYQMLKKNKP